MSVVTLFSPVGEVANSPATEAQSEHRLGSLAGAFLGFIDDMKPNAGAFLQLIEEMINADHGLRGSHTVRKYVTPNMAIAHELDPMVEGAVVAWGD